MGSSGSGSNQGSTTVVQQPAPGQIAPEFRQFATNVGTGAISQLQNFPLDIFANPVILPVPGLNPMQQSALNLIGNRTQYGIDRPYGEQALYNLMPYASDVATTQVGLQPNEYQALQYAQALPGMAGQTVNTDPMRTQAYGNTQALQQWAATPVGMDPVRQHMYAQAQGLQGQVGQQVPMSQMRGGMVGHAGNTQQTVGGAVGLQAPELAALGTYGQLPNAVGFGSNPYELAGANTLSQFSSGGPMGSPAMLAAASQIANAVTPQVQNRMAHAGLGRSGAMANELQNAMVGALLPLFMQGMQQQQSAGTTLANMGLQQQGQVLGAMGQSAGGQAQIGGQMAGRQGEALQRYMGMEPIYQQAGTGFANAQEGLAGDSLARMLAAQPYLQQAGQGMANAREGLSTDAMQRAIGLEPLLQQSATGIAGSREGLSTDALNRMQQAISGVTVPTFMNAGGQEAQRQSDTINRILQTTMGQYNPLLQLGGNEANRETQRINEALQAGALQRDIQGQIYQAQYADAMRRQALAETFHTAMLGAIPSLTTFPSTSTTTYRSPVEK